MKAETHDGIFEVAPTLLSTAATTSRPPSIRGEDSPPFELGGPAHALSRDELSDFLFSGSHFEGKQKRDM